MPPKRAENKQLSALNWFLTFPQSGQELTKDKCLERIFLKWKQEKFEFIIIAQELHESGEPHLHLVLSFKDKLRTRNRGEFDFIAQKHGNYQTVRHIKKTIAYVLKQDPQPLTYGKIPEVKRDSGKQKHSKSKEVVELLKSGSSMETIFEKHPDYFLLNKKKIEDLASWLAIKAHRESLPLIKFPLSYEGEDPGTLTIVDWLNKNLSSPMPFKAPHLYIHGPTNHCKTSLVNLLGKFIPIYYMPTEDFYDFYADKDYHLCVLDEFKATKTIQFLNLWLQGCTMNIRKKGSQALKISNIPTIILSNYSLDECYTKILKNKNPDDPPQRIVNDKLDTLKGRLTIVELWSPIEVDKIKITPLKSIPEEITTQFIPPEDDSQPKDPPDCSETIAEVPLIDLEPATPPTQIKEFDWGIDFCKKRTREETNSENEEENDNFLQIPLRKKYKF